MSLDDRLRQGLAEAAGRAPIDPDGDQRAALALGRRRQRRQRVVLASALVVVVAGVALGVWQLAGGDGSDGTTIAGPPSTTAPRDGGGEVAGEGSTAPAEPSDGSPPPVRVVSPDKALDLQPFAYCYGSVCADGAPSSPLPDIGTADGLIVAFPLSGWSFTATFTEVVPDGRCPREQQVPLEGSGTSFTLLPAGFAGTYDVTLFGRGDGGDVAVAFRWTSRFDGPLAEPTARLAVLADHDGRVDSYGVELEVADLDRTPDAASATITVRAADGQEVSFPAPGTPDATCREGYLYWAGALDRERAAAVLAGQAPFTYEVDLVLDGVHHTATASWPHDQIAGNEPSVPLSFTPRLPALADH